MNPAKQKTTKADECADWLERHLHGHKAKMSELKVSAKNEGYGEKALSTACTSLGVIRSKDGFGGDVWVSLPGGVVDDGLEF